MLYQYIDIYISILYLDIVKRAIPFLPQVPIFRPLPVLEDLNNFSIQVLDFADIVVSKLKRFNANDTADVEFLVRKGLVSHENLLERFRLVVDHYSTDARAADLPKYLQNLHKVERAMFFVPESKIGLPEWI